MNLEPRVRVRSGTQRDGTPLPASATPTTELSWRKLALMALESAKHMQSPRHVSALESALRVGGTEVERVMRQLSLVGRSDVEREFSSPPVQGAPTPLTPNNPPAARASQPPQGVRRSRPKA